MSVDELAAKIGKNRATVYRYESNDIEDLPTSVLEPLSKALCTTPSYLMGWEKKPSDIPDPIENAAIPVHRIPVLGRIRAGLPMYAEENIVDYIYTTLNGGNEYFGLLVVGDSMNAARIYEDDIIVVRKQEQVEDGEIAVVMVGDEDATVKRFHRNGRKVMLSPQSFNPEHQVQVYDLKETSIRIVGKVVQVVYKME